MIATLVIPRSYARSNHSDPHKKFDPSGRYLQLERSAPMVQTLLPMLPREQGTMPLVFTLAAAGAGLLLWATGARFSRTIVTLTLVAMGAVVGDALPSIFGWGINAM